MKIKKGFFFILILSIVLSSCAEQEPIELPTPQAKVTSVPEVDGLAQSYLEAWEAENYEAMYTQLSGSSQAVISLQDFTAYYEDTASSATISSIDTQVLSTFVNPNAAEAPFKVTFTTSLFGAFEREMRMPFVWENGSLEGELGSGNDNARVERWKPPVIGST